MCLHKKREIGRKDDRELMRNSKSARNLGFFLQHLARNLPKHVYKDMAVIISHLDGEVRRKGGEKKGGREEQSFSLLRERNH